MAIASGTDQANLLSDLNTTPLIDVMLVLLIMFIVTIPIQTHSVKVDQPVANDPLPLPQQAKNKVVITREGLIMWNGSVIDRIRLRQYLDMTQRMSPIPELHLEPDGQAPYAVIDDVLAATKRAQVTKMGLTGNEKYAAAF